MALEIMALPNITKPNIIQALPSILFEPSLTLPPSVEPGFLFPSGERAAEAEQALGEDRTFVGKWDWMEEQKEDPLKDLLSPHQKVPGRSIPLSNTTGHSSCPEGLMRGGREGLLEM